MSASDDCSQESEGMPLELARVYADELVRPLRRIGDGGGMGLLGDFADALAKHGCSGMAMDVALSIPDAIERFEALTRLGPSLSSE